MDVSFCLAALGGGAGEVRQAGDFQHRPRLAVHFGRLHVSALADARASCDRHAIAEAAGWTTCSSERLLAVASSTVRTSISRSYADGREAARGIAEWVAFYNDRRPRIQALADRMPMAVWRKAIVGARAVGMMDAGLRVAHRPTAATADAASRCVIKRNEE